MTIVLGVTGGIAAYKACEVVRGLRRRGCTVTVALTRTAARFITPTTLRALSGREVIETFFDGGEAEIRHISLARECEALVIAPATAHVIAKLARGLADDFLSTFALAVRCPILIAPAMNPRMWDSPAVRENVSILEGRGVQIIGPDEGALAEEEWGVGRLAEPQAIVERTLGLVGSRSTLAGRTVLVTAGPTWERLDDVRILSNLSSGKMGYAVARAALRRGARVILVSGPTVLPDPEGAEVIRVTSAAEMHEAVMSRAGEAGIVVKAAAVADYTPAAPARGKVKKTGEPIRLEMIPTRDILADLAGLGGKRVLVGFAAETGDLVSHARAKLEAKRLDLIVANDVSGGAVFGKDESACVILDGSGGELRLERQTKAAIAERILDLVEERLPA